jgi:hypothetical protein
MLRKDSLLTLRTAALAHSAGPLRDQSDEPMRDAGLPASLILEPAELITAVSTVT